MLKLRFISYAALACLIIGVGLLLASRPGPARQVLLAATGGEATSTLGLPRNFTGVIGVQVWRNPKRLQPADWYNTQDFPKGSPQGTTVDGFPAITEGTSVYVSAPNYLHANSPNTPLAYVNVYLLSYGQGSDSATQEITKRLLQNWQFMSRLPSDIQDGPALAREELRRDNERLTALGTIIQGLQQYRSQHDTFPLLDSGTYIQGHTVSTWPSWQQTLGTNLGMTMPLDPLNNFDTDGDGQSNCDTASGYNAATCYRAPDVGRPQGDYQCLDDSHVFEFVHGSATDQLFANFEFKNITWPGALNVPNSDVAIGAGRSCRSFFIDLANNQASWGRLRPNN